MPKSKQNGRSDGEIVNYYEAYGIKRNDPTKAEDWPNNYIEPNSHCIAIGGTGSGKTNLLRNFLKSKSNVFTEVSIFTGSTEHEDLYERLLEEAPIKFYTQIEEVPSLKEVEEDENYDKHNQKLMVFDDFITLPKKQQVKIEEYIISSRKLGYTCFLLTQDFTRTSPTIRRNIQYFFILKQNELGSLNLILRNHSFGFDKQTIMSWYNESVKKPFGFFTIDCKTNNPMLRFRRNFIILFNR